MDENSSLSEDKLRKQKEFVRAGIDPYPYSYEQTDHAADINSKYAKLEKGEETKDHASIAGRIMQFRAMGRVSFMHVQDQTGRVQLYFQEDLLGKENYELVKKLDSGDIIGAEGEIFKTRMGEVTVKVKKFTLLTKSLRMLPEKYHGLQDVELRYRQRYLDLIMNPEVKEVFFKRTKIIGAVREFMNSKGFIDVETPLLQTMYGGAEAKPFVTHINAWNMEMYLSISPELYLKRLLVGGFEKVFTICKNFRNEGVDRTHNPEFTMMELYQAYADYEDMMKLTEEMFEFVAKKVLGRTKITVEGNEIDLKAPWKRMTVYQALKKFADLDVEHKTDKELKDLLHGYNIEYEGDFKRGLAIALLFEELCEAKLTQPTFIVDYPREISPLCKQKRGKPELIEKVEPYINGWEMGNGYSELNDPILQRELLSEQAEKLRAGFEEAQPMDEDFLRAIEFGMPPAGGMGIGIDRMIILMTEQPSLRDVLLFPIMKPEAKEETPKVQQEKAKEKLKTSLKSK